MKKSARRDATTARWP